jgi:hypothetical protein
VRELVPMLLETGRLISTTPPPIAKVEPFLLGAGMITRGQASRTAKPAAAKGEGLERCDIRGTSLHSAGHRQDAGEESHRHLADAAILGSGRRYSE